MSQIFQKPPNNYQYLIGIENNVDEDSVDVTVLSPSGGEVTLHTVVIPGNTLIRDGQRLLICGVGRCENPIAIATFRLRVNGAAVYEFGKAISAANNRWFIDLLLIRQGGDLITLSNSSYLHPVGGVLTGAQQMQGASGPLLPADFTQPLTVAFSVEDAGGVGDTIVQHASWVTVQ